MTESILAPNYEEHLALSGYKSFVKDIGPLMCDLYALTMTQALWLAGQADTKRSVSHVFCRNLTGNGQAGSDGKQQRVPYLINAGLGLVAEWLDGWAYSYEDLHYLATIRVPDGKGLRSGDRVFSNEFLFWLSKQRLTLNIDAVPEGELIGPQEPSLKLWGLFWQQQVVEGALLHLVSSSTNLTTVASQMRLFTQRDAARAGTDVVEASAADVLPRLEQAGLADMSLRRNLSIGALQSARATAITGWNSTSNVYAGKCYDIPVMGTFAHAWVMLHDTEEEAFENWAKAYPNTTIFLADTYDTLEGVHTALRICSKYGLKLKGIRLDSGNIDQLSRDVAAACEKAGVGQVRIFATDKVNRASAYTLYGGVRSQAENAESRVTDFGIGSEVAVNLFHPLLDEVMKLGALYQDDGVSLAKTILKDVVKVSESSTKTTLPGALDVIRYFAKHTDGKMIFAGDAIVPTSMNLGQDTLSKNLVLINPAVEAAQLVVPQGTAFYRPLQPWMRHGKMVQAEFVARDAAAVLAKAKAQYALTMDRLPAPHKRFKNPQPYLFGIETGLATKRDALVHQAHTPRRPSPAEPLYSHPRQETSHL